MFVVDAEPPTNAILVSPAEFVKCVVKFLEKSFSSTDGFRKDVAREIHVTYLILLKLHFTLPKLRNHER